MNPFENLSDKERDAFLKKMQDHQKKKNEEAKLLRKNEFYNSNENIKDNVEHESLLITRRGILKNLQITKEDWEVLDSLNDLDEKHREYLSMFYILTTIDSFFVVEKRFSFQIALETKFLYVFGTQMNKGIEDVSKSTVLWKICYKIYNWMEKIYQENYEKTEYLNHLLSLLKVFAIALPYDRSLLTDNFTLGCKSLSDQHRYCIVIDPAERESDLMQEIYNFFYEKIGRNYFDKLSPKTFSPLRLFTDSEDAKKGLLSRKRNKGAEGVLANKLGSLRRRTDLI